ncbi:MAG TPA: hypothetical protein VIE17_00915 [Methylophilaceae bacterium]
MKTSTQQSKQPRSIVGKLMMALLISSALGSVTPALADPYYDHDRDHHYDHRDWHHDHRHWDRYDHDRVYVEPTPVYAPPPVYYAPAPSAGISVVLPIHIR